MNGVSIIITQHRYNAHGLITYKTAISEDNSEVYISDIMEADTHTVKR